MSLVRSIHQSMGITVVLVSHLLNVLFNYVHRVMFLKDKRMRIFNRNQALSPGPLGEIYETPVTVGEVDGKLVIVPGGENNADSS